VIFLVTKNLKTGLFKETGLNFFVMTDVFKYLNLLRLKREFE